MKRRPHDIVEVSWVDSSSGGHAEVWGAYSTFMAGKTNTLECRTVGYVLFETKQQIGVVGSLALHDDPTSEGIGQVSGTITIPKCAILERRVLSKGIKT